MAFWRCLQGFRHPVTVTTKGTLVERDADILGEMGQAGLARVGLSVTTLDADLARRMEPRCPSPARRLRAIERLSRAGCPVRVMVSPIVPGLTDHELEAILTAARDAGAVAASMIPLRLPLEVSELWQAWLAEHYPARQGRVMSKIRDMHGGRDYDPEWGKRMTGEGLWAELLQKRFGRAVRALGLEVDLPDLRSDLFLRHRRARAINCRCSDGPFRSRVALGSLRTEAGMNWDARYAREGYLFGKDPAAFLSREATRIPDGARVLSVADGEGRNSVYLATLGHDVRAFDLSPNAVAKARTLAAEAGVDVAFNLSGIEDWDWTQPVDAIVAIFIQFQGPEARAATFARFRESLAPGGLLLLHGYAPRQVDYGTGGPPHAENMYTLPMLREAFAGWEVLHEADYDAVIEEGERPFRPVGPDRFRGAQTRRLRPDAEAGPSAPDAPPSATFARGAAAVLGAVRSRGEPAQFGRDDFERGGVPARRFLQRGTHVAQMFGLRAAASADDPRACIARQHGVTRHQLGRAVVMDVPVHVFRDARVALRDDGPFRARRTEAQNRAQKRSEAPTPQLAP